MNKTNSEEMIKNCEESKSEAVEVNDDKMKNPSSFTGSIGGMMVRRMIEAYEKSIR